MTQSDGAASAAAGLQYEIADRTGTGSTQLDFEEIRSLIRRGRLARSDQIAVGGRWQTLGQVEAFKPVFSGIAPQADDLRASPDLIGEGDTLALLEVFARLFHERRTGRLFVFHAELGHERTVVLRDGVPIAAFSNVRDEWIGELLLKKKLIDEASYEQAVARRAQTGEQLGEVLIALEKITPKRMQMALSAQALERLLNLFRAGQGTRFRFTPDPSAADEDVLLSARPREIIETAISTAMGPSEVRELLEGYTDGPISVHVPDELKRELTSGDDAILDILRHKLTLEKALPRICAAARLTESEARVRLLALATFGVIALGGKETRQLTEELASLQRQSYFDMLGVRMAADGDALKQAAEKRRTELGLDDPDKMAGAAGRLRAQMGTLLDQAVNTLQRPFERAVYLRAQQMGVDLEDPQSRKLVEFDEYMAIGHSALQAEQFTKAREAFKAATERAPEDPRPHVQLGWARFLESGRHPQVAAKAIKEVEKALKIQSDFDVAWLYIGKINRLIGNHQQAEDALRKAIALNDRNTEAQSELRLIFARELGNKGLKAIKVDIKVDRGAIWAVSAVLFMTALFFVGANLIPGGLTLWPDPSARATDGPTDEMMRDTVALVNLRLHHTEKELVGAAQELGSKGIEDKAGALAYLAKYDMAQVREALAAARKVPPDMQKLGNAEYFHMPKDSFWWGRRGALLLVALLLLFTVGRRMEFTQTVMGTAPSWVGAAVPYGLIVGFLSGVLPVEAGLGMLLVMTLVHVTAEQLFFSAFVNRALLKGITNPAIAIGVAGLLFGLYHVSYFAIFQQPSGPMLMDMLRIGAFAGAAYAALLWKSGGLAAPFVAHLLVSGTMLMRSGLVGG